MPSHRSRLISTRNQPRHSLWSLATVVAGSALILSPASTARFSDPVRNLHPEEPSAPPEVQSPIHYVLPTASPADPSGVSPEALLQQFLDKHTSLNYPAAAEAALRLINLVPDRPSGYYNLACAMARMQRIDEAMDALQQAVEHGWRDALHMSIDPDLGALRNDPRFRQMVAEVRTRVEAERIVPAPPRTDPWQTVAADLSREIPALLKTYHVPGATVALINDGKVVWTSAFGVRDARSSDSALGVDDPFRVRAPLHMLAITACGELERENKVHLAALMQDAVNQYAMVTADPPRRSTDDRPLTRPTLTRNTGENDAQRASSTDAAAAGEAAPVSRTRSYSRGSVYGVLRLAVEAAAEDNFSGYCESALLKPMELHQTAFNANERSWRVVLGHSYLGTPLRPSVVADEFNPGGSLYITAGDLARLIAQTMAGPGTEDDGGIFLGDLPDCHGRGSGPASTDPATERPAAGAQEAPPSHATPSATPVANSTPTDPDEQHRRQTTAWAIDLVTRVDAALPGGLGLALQRVDGADGTRMELSESASGIVCLARWCPATRSGIVILCNSATAREAAERIAHTALGGG